MKLDEIKLIYVAKTFNSYKRLVNEYVAIDFNNKVIAKMNEKTFEKFMNRNLGNLVRAKSVVNNYIVHVYLVKENIVQIETKNNRTIAFMQKKGAVNLFDFYQIEIEQIDENDAIEINKAI